MADATPTEWPPPTLAEWLRSGTVITCHLVSELRGWLSWAEAGHRADECRGCFAPPVVTPSRTDKQPPDSATQAKGGETPVRPEATKRPDSVTRDEGTNEHG